jgi:hypothetical protein
LCFFAGVAAAAAAVFGDGAGDGGAELAELTRVMFKGIWLPISGSDFTTGRMTPLISVWLVLPHV